MLTLLIGLYIGGLYIAAIAAMLMADYEKDSWWDMTSFVLFWPWYACVTFYYLHQIAKHEEDFIRSHKDGRR